jgi:hypothetical protein
MRSIGRIEEAHRKIASKSVHLTDGGKEVMHVALHAAELGGVFGASPTSKALSSRIDAAVVAFGPLFERMAEGRRCDRVFPLDACGARCITRDRVTARGEIDAESSSGFRKEGAPAINVCAMGFVDARERALRFLEGANPVIA